MSKQSDRDSQLWDCGICNEKIKQCSPAIACVTCRCCCHIECNGLKLKDVKKKKKLFFSTFLCTSCLQKKKEKEVCMSYCITSHALLLQVPSLQLFIISIIL